MKKLLLILSLILSSPIFAYTAYYPTAASICKDYSNVQCTNWDIEYGPEQVSCGLWATKCLEQDKDNINKCNKREFISPEGANNCKANYDINSKCGQLITQPGNCTQINKLPRATLKKTCVNYTEPKTKTGGTTLGQKFICTDQPPKKYDYAKSISLPGGQAKVYFQLTQEDKDKVKQLLEYVNATDEMTLHDVLFKLLEKAGSNVSSLPDYPNKAFLRDLAEYQILQDLATILEPSLPCPKIGEPPVQLKEFAEEPWADIKCK